MSLDLPNLAPQIQAAGAVISEELKAASAHWPKVLSAFEAARSLPPDELGARLARAGENWRGAAPVSDDLGLSAPAPALEASLEIVGADGSQITPDRHAAALFYLINVGSLVYSPGSGLPPVTATRPSLYAGREQLYLPEGGLVGADLVHAHRDLAEMAELARVVEARQGTPCLALLDNGLTLWIALQEQGQPRQATGELVRTYLSHMDRIRSAGAALAGVIDRPRHTSVLSLLHLLELPIDSLASNRLNEEPYPGLSDRALFGRHLPEGHRSAIFKVLPAVPEFKAAGHEVAFFYFRPAGMTEAMRVEIPVWAAEDPALVNRVHAGLVEQGQSTGGFPYVLARAHELAVVTQADRQVVNRMLDEALLKHGVRPDRSRKQTAKRWLGGRRRHQV
jgi:NurA domain